jgi:hypothetical protein
LWQLLEQRDDRIASAGDGDGFCFADSRDWVPCDAETEAVVDGATPSYLAKQFLRMLGPPPRRRAVGAGAGASRARPETGAGAGAGARRVGEALRGARGTVFPELQALLLQRLARPTVDAATQTDDPRAAAGAWLHGGMPTVRHTFVRLDAHPLFTHCRRPHSHADEGDGR